MINITGLFIFASGILVIQDLQKPEFNFTIANSLLYIAAVFQLLFCQSLIRPVSKRMQYGFALSVIIFVPTFEYFRLYGSYEIRTILMCAIAVIFFSWQIAILRQKRGVELSRQLMYLQYATAAELLFALGRLGVLASTGFTISRLEQIPQLLILLTIGQLVINTLSYIALGGVLDGKGCLSKCKIPD